MLLLGAHGPLRGAQHVHALDVPGHRYETPLALSLLQTAHAHLRPAHHLLDDAKHRRQQASLWLGTDPGLIRQVMVRGLKRLIKSLC